MDQVSREGPSYVEEVREEEEEEEEEEGSRGLNQKPFFCALLRTRIPHGVNTD